MTWPLAFVLMTAIVAINALAAWMLWLYATGDQRTPAQAARTIDWPATELPEAQ